MYCQNTFLNKFWKFKNKFNFKNYLKTIFRPGRSTLLAIFGCSLVHVVHVCRTTGRLVNWAIDQAVYWLSHLSLYWNRLTGQSIGRSASSIFEIANQLASVTLLVIWLLIFILVFNLCDSNCITNITFWTIFFIQ